MTEVGWERAQTPWVMIQSLDPRRFDRKLRLFAVACCRAAGLDNDSLRQEVLELSEMYADDPTAKARLEVAADHLHDTQRVRAAYAVSCASARGRVGVQELRDLYQRAVEQAGECLLAGRFDEPQVWQVRQAYLRPFLDAQVALLRDIVGNPFRPVAFDPGWRSSTAVALARQMYDARDFDPMPVLADALEEAGCNAAGLLAHCRGPGPHVRGCWAVDLVLGKT